jgi:DNA-binding NarL/FixJ family response regulator
VKDLKSKKRRVLIVDDHPIVCEGLRRLIDDERDLVVCGEASSIKSALAVMADCVPDLVVVDLLLGKDSGVDLIKRIREANSKTPILVVSVLDELQFAARVFRAGANGYVMKQETMEQLLLAMRTLLSGQHFASAAVLNSMLGEMSGHVRSRTSRIDLLSERELEVLRLLGMGLSTANIAGRLFVSKKTIESHRLRIKQKLGANTVSELVASSARWLETGAFSLG